MQTALPNRPHLISDTSRSTPLFFLKKNLSDATWIPCTVFQDLSLVPHFRPFVSLKFRASEHGPFF